MKYTKNGFTMAELLIVVAIIAVLAAVGIPIFNRQIEKKRESTDLANVRSAYAEVLSSALIEDKTEYYENGIYYIDVPLEQTISGWQTLMEKVKVGEISATDKTHWLETPEKSGVCRVYYDEKSEEMYLNWSGKGGNPSGSDVDYDSPLSIGQYVMTYLNGLLTSFNEGTLDNQDLNKLFKNLKSDYRPTLTLPNGETINLIIYNRDYDKFQYVNDRFLTENTATIIYNKDKKCFSTIIFHTSDKNYVSWSIDDDENSWKSAGSWKEKAY